MGCRRSLVQHSRKAWPKVLRSLRDVVDAALEPFIMSEKTTVEDLDDVLQQACESRTGSVWVNCLIKHIFRLQLYILAEGWWSIVESDKLINNDTIFLCRRSLDLWMYPVPSYVQVSVTVICPNPQCEKLMINMTQWPIATKNNWVDANCTMLQTGIRLVLWLENAQTRSPHNMMVHWSMSSAGVLSLTMLM